MKEKAAVVESELLYAALVWINQFMDRAGIGKSDMLAEDSRLKGDPGIQNSINQSSSAVGLHAPG